jgi:hypothetical protein
MPGPLVAVAGSISGTVGTVAEAVPANLTTIIARLLPSKKSRDVVIVFILFTLLKKSQLICVEARTASARVRSVLPIRLLVPRIRLKMARLVQPELAVPTLERVRSDAGPIQG